MQITMVDVLTGIDALLRRGNDRNRTPIMAADVSGWLAMVWAWLGHCWPLLAIACALLDIARALGRLRGRSN
jgi:hypothetical protein